MKHTATTHGTMPVVVPNTLEKLRIIIDREDLGGTEHTGPLLGIAPSTLRGYFANIRRPSKFARLHLEKLVAAYERGGLAELKKAAKDARD